MEQNILYGPPRDETFNPSNETVGWILYSSLKQHGNNVAQIDSVTGRKLTYSDILKDSCILASNLHYKQIYKGDVISICSENRLEFCVPVIAALYIGAVCAPLNPAYTTDELIHGLSITKPKMIFCSASTLRSVCDAVRRCHLVSEVIIFDEEPVSVSFRTYPYRKLIKPESLSFRVEEFELTKFNPKELTAVVLCSSGTTGLPKGVKLSHSNLESFFRTCRNPESSGLYRGATIMGLVPFYHGYGYGVVLYSCVIGAKLIVLPRFEEKLFLSSIEKYKINILHIVPPLMVFLSKHPLVHRYDLSSIERIVTGAAPCGLSTLNDVTKKLKLNTIHQGYGMTEISIVITTSPNVNNKLGSVGRLAPEAQAKVVDLKTRKPVGPNAVGELCFRGPQVMQGYYNNHKATAETIDKDGWLYTGDIGYYDEEGFFFIVDRLKELIKYKGFQVAPAELESLILSHPAVQDVAVIGVPDEMSGELPKAFVIKQPGARVTEDDIVKFVESRVSAQKKLRGGVEFISAIPKNPSGKILRRILRTQHLKSKL